MTLYIFDVNFSGVYPICPPTSFIRSEAFVAFGAAVRRGRYVEMWDNGKCVHRMGPHCVLPR